MTKSCDLRFWGTVRALACRCGLAWAGWFGVAGAEVVDQEVLLLVDVTRSVSDADFSVMMDGYADAFEASAVIDSITNGTVGSIAAAVVFYADKNSQVVGVGWMEISDATEAGAFADQMRVVSRPFDKNKTSIANALDYSVPLFGTETGGAGNGFESTTQQILMAADGVDDHSPTGGSREAVVEASRDAALADGVDVINALTVGAAGSVDTYFAQYVIGGGVGGTPTQVINVPDFASFGAGAAQQLQTVVPEPVIGIGMLMCLAMLVCRRDRR